LPISKRVSRIGISPTMKVNAEAKAMQARGEDVIDLSVGEPDFSTPQNIKDAAKRALDNNDTKYTVNQGRLELRVAIAEKLKNENGLEYSASNIIVSTGAKQGLFNAIQCLVHDEDEVIFSAPYYVSYPEMITLAHGKSVPIQTTEETGFNMSPEQLERAITPKSKVLIMGYPTNPTGSSYNKSELYELAKVVESNNLYVITDDIYEHLIYDDNRFVCFASLNEKMKERTVVVNGFSKTYAMTGWRIGYAAGPEEIIQAMNKVQSHSTSNTCTISQAAAIEALHGPQDFVSLMRNEYEHRRNIFYGLLTSIDGITCVKPKGAFYVFPNVTKYFHKSTSLFRIENSFDLAMYLLHNAKVATVPGSAFGTEGYIRMSYSCSLENLVEAAKRIKEALLKLT
jgi:aspartate/methionine/tyrosine aminotransferase